MITLLNVSGLELCGAYGRKTVMDDWRAGKDFKITGGSYCSNRDIDEMRKSGFQMLEFMQGDELVERVFIDESLAHLAESGHGTFERVA